MVPERNFSVTEARVGLSLLTCLLLVLGYVALQRLGGAGSPPPIEVRPGHSDSTTGVRGATSPEIEQPQLLITQGSDESDPANPYPYSAMRPQWLSPQGDPLNSTPADSDSPLFGQQRETTPAQFNADEGPRSTRALDDSSTR